jgi:hypothetical protein
VIEPIPLDRLTTTAHGVTRPEDVKITADGRVLVSDAASAVAEVLADGSLRRFGAAGGEPNGLAPMPDGSVVVANFAAGVLQRVDLGSGAVEVVLDSVDGQPLGAVNYPLLDRDGALWVSSSTRTDPVATIASGEEDGFLFRLDPDGSATVVADSVAWPNCMTFDDDERYLYACRSSRCDVVRFAVEGTGAGRTLGPAERYGPQLGDRRPDESGPGRGVRSTRRPRPVGSDRRLRVRRRGQPLGDAPVRQPHRGRDPRPRGRDRDRRPRGPGGRVAHERRLRRTGPPPPVRRLAGFGPPRHRPEPGPRPGEPRRGPSKRLTNKVGPVRLSP